MRSALFAGFDEIRQVLPEHLPAISEIERASYNVPWTTALLKDCLKPNYHFYVMFRREKVLAYGIISCILSEAHILNLCVNPGYRRQGIGGQMLRFLLEKAKQEASRTVFLEVRQSNRIARHLYDVNGFNRLGSRKGYYPDKDGREDAIIYAKKLVVNPIVRGRSALFRFFPKVAETLARGKV